MAWLKIGAALLIGLLSIKPVSFTWNLAMGCYHRTRGNPRFTDYIHQCITHKPKAYANLKKYTPRLDEKILQGAIYTGYRDKKNTLEHLLPALGTGASTLETAARGNVYFRYLFPDAAGHRGEDPGNPREHLDAVSLDILADPAMNPLTMALFRDHILGGAEDRQWLKNLMDYCLWRGNSALADELAARFRLDRYRQRQTPLPPAPATASAKPSGNNVWPGVPGFDSDNGGDGDESLLRKWRFSRMAGYEPFSEGVFVMGLDPGGNNPRLRMMGLAVRHRPGQSKPRGGAWYRKPIPLENAVYIFSFDYFCKTGAEAPSFLVAAGRGEIRPPVTPGTWQTATHRLDNSRGEIPAIKPLIRIWGTGTLLVDNLSLTRATTGE